jgi:hypothetical protein
MNIQEKRRQVFEAWFEGLNHCRPEIGFSGSEHYYVHQRVEDAWNVWNAALDSVVIELPDWFSPNDCGDKAYWADLVVPWA